MASALFACTNCHKRYVFEDLSKDDQLCKECRRKHPSVSCSYCRIEFHQLRRTDGDPVCQKCSDNLKLYGQPSNCVYCNIRSAFKGNKCLRCQSSEKRYGAPIQCEECNLQCAFQKTNESRQKVNGRLLCLLCTLAFKRIQHQKNKKRPKESHDSHQKSKHPKKRRSEKERPTSTLKPEKASIKPLSSNSVTSSPMLTRESLETADVTSSDHMTEITALREELESIKKLLQQKDKIIIEKDRKISQVEAMQWEKEKDLRAKLKTIQKESQEKIERLQNENTTLKKQAAKGSRPQKVEKRTIVSSPLLQPDEMSTF